MIVVRLIGGLGNQMFQYAAGRSLAKHHATELFLDTTYLEKDPNGAYTLRSFELVPFRILSKIADSKLLDIFSKKSKFLTRFGAYFPFLFKKLSFNESKNFFHSNFFNLPSSTYLNGYWQDENYFKTIRKELLQEFSLEKESELFLKFKKELAGVESVALHVRRGDYINLSSAANFHGVLDIEYYNASIKYMRGKVGKPVFYVFSDDISWCKENLSSLADLIFVEGLKQGFSAQEELMLMSQCKHIIIANSSFSWWAAWLNKNEQKLVVAPKRWFKSHPTPKGLIPKTWKKI